MAYTKEQIQEKIDEKFPGKGYKLLAYTKADEPITILCPQHGEQVVSRYSNFIKSVSGCPVCGKEQSGKTRKGSKIVSKEALEQLVETEAQRIVANSDAVLHGQFRFWSSNDKLPEDEFVYAPFYKDVRFAAGHGSQENEDHNGFQIPFGRATLFRHGVQPNDVIAASVTGDSMEPRLFAGDTIGIDKGSRTIRNGEIYAVVNQGELLIKQCFKVGKTQIRLHSYNPEYLDIYLPVEDIEVVGRVFWVSAML